MTPAEFAAIRDLIHRRTGIYFDEEAAQRLSHRLADRLAARGYRTYTEYYLALQRLPAGEPEFDEIVERITTHETYFFRERYQLAAFSDEILPELRLRLRDTRTLRIWSAGCATGEEVYTIAMLILDHGGFAGWNVEVFGTDISRKVIARARQGVYGANSFREGHQRYLERHFSRADGGMYRVRDQVRALAAFGTINLVDPASLALVAPVDVIFCRNVLIYFHPDSRRSLAETFFHKLRAGGYLLLGHAESLLNVTNDFEIVSLKNDLVYRRPEMAWKRP
ncbi:MAG: protein-glutamate O-methyltransferase CheR [Deltaproteobacteria bacterium]|nr:protein-glutamate O-methyltransferase CheR [Deltaproteobacteria bacterium]